MDETAAKLVWIAVVKHSPLQKLNRSGYELALKKDEAIREQNSKKQLVYARKNKPNATNLKKTS